MSNLQPDPRHQHPHPPTISSRSSYYPTPLKGQAATAATLPSPPRVMTVPAPSQAAAAAAAVAACDQHHHDAAVCHPVFFTPRLMRPPLPVPSVGTAVVRSTTRPLSSSLLPPPPLLLMPNWSAMMSPVAHGYVYQQKSGRPSPTATTGTMPKL
ncbi:hypothetical protein BD289DRAFT_17755 [Coniella lustricola]|uniref:Uncharacterized protein n=1 Tax=Coniella lustricola TaxID=2025994 RepID=A0A2T3AJ85_9PEZI|nr:hypothetical protein BD289DRAFT_17755 [Coniella lustricola]